MNRDDWPELKSKLAAVIKTKTRDEWCRASWTPPTSASRPVLGLDEARDPSAQRRAQDLRRASRA